MQLRRTWVPEEWLVDMAEQQKGKFAELPWEQRAGTPRPCPACTTPMPTLTLAGIDLDRCTEHGVWFDPSELPAVLAKAKQFPEATPTTERPVPLMGSHVPREDSDFSKGVRASEGFIESIARFFRRNDY
ncbi:MAG: zf-TFIIB domain-containing protein [Deltaproteobacteria bacterium]|nr:zf-TFIIB domain-containing protein [Deltaproteobacteria bacterium]